MHSRLAALIDEEHCIGCGKCIRVCPTDAIVGAKHRLHTILSQYCTSCERCVNACPTNCISLNTPVLVMSQEMENQLISEKQARLSVNQSILPNTIHGKIILNKVAPKVEAPSRKQLVADAIARAKARRNVM